MKIRPQFKALLIILLPAIILLGIFLGRKRAEHSLRSSAWMERFHYSNVKIYSTWDRFLSSGEWQSYSSGNGPKVVFIGMDGATWNIIDPMIESGELPALERLKAEGAYGVLRSVECFISPPAWVTMMTGVLPSKSGVYTFGKWDEENYKFNTVSAEDVRVPNVWDIASIAGKKVAVTNIPITYPAQKVNGIMVSGMLTPITLEERRPVFILPCTNYSGDLLEVLKLKSYSTAWGGSVDVHDNYFTFVLYDETDDGISNYDSGIISIIPKRKKEQDSRKILCYDFKPGIYSPWLNIDFEKDEKVREAWCQVKVTTEEFPTIKARVSPVFIAPDDPDVLNTHPENLSKVLKKEFKYYFPYTPFDKDQIPSFAKDAARYASFFYGYDDWDLFLYAFLGPDRIQHREGFSDKTHEVYKTIDHYIGRLIEKLPEEAVLIVASDHGFKDYKYSIDLNSFFAGLGLLKWGEGREIDHENTLAYYNMYSVFFNYNLLTAGELSKRGIPLAPGEKPKDAFVRYLKEAGMNLEDPETGRIMPLEFLPPPEYAVGRAPDLLVTGGYTDYKVELWDYKNPHESVVRLLVDDESWSHKRDGIFFIWGKNVKPGYDAGVKDIQDIAPTMLYVLGLPLAEYLEGRVMEDVFIQGYLAQHPVAMVQKYAEISRSSQVPDEEREALEKKLKSLGYIR